MAQEHIGLGGGISGLGSVPIPYPPLALALASAVRMLPVVSITTANQRVVGASPRRVGIGFATLSTWPATARVSPANGTPSGFGIALTAGSILWLDVGTFSALIPSEWWAIDAAGNSLAIFESYLPG